ncbi:MAG: antibiotic biosynthesis monooxygenase [Bacteroidia bacterium]|nr:antibiotic biosynthesis monooxygenase [Bacteroidia bacterium]
MLIRLVKMSFNDHDVADFLKMFDDSKEKIRRFDGCNGLELYRDKDNPNQFFTYSYWVSEGHLEAYRRSELFRKVCGSTKILFNDSPEAWSVDKIVSLP